MNKNLLLDLLQDPQLRALVQRHAAAAHEGTERSLEKRLDRYAQQLKSDRFVLPIAGVQGSGKSTMLNAIAFDEPVLPIDADETTCVPVEIRWAANPQAQAIVHYAQGHTETLPCTEDALREVVHNENNPGNEKQVQRVVLESNRALFREGLVLVDLPGTGSLTQANMATTQSYLSEAVGVIFMLRTVPPITQSEATFIALQWGSLRTALFVQNRWNDEGDDEALDGHDHNVKVLESIAGKARIQLNRSPSIHVVNGYQALEAALTQDASLAQMSGIDRLRAELERFGQDWSQRVGNDIRQALNTDLGDLVKGLQQRMADLQQDRADLQAKMAEHQREFADRLAHIDRDARQMRDDADTFRQQIRQTLDEWIRNQGAELRNRMRTKMRAGIVDGARLKRALDDEQAQTTDDIFMQVQEEALALQDRLRSHLREADAWTAQAPDLRVTVDREAGTKWENLAQPMGSAVGGLGGAWAGAKAGALLGAGAGPIGSVIGSVLGGLFGGLSGHWLGNQSKQWVTEHRAQAAEAEVFRAIDTYLHETSGVLNDQAKQFCDQLDIQLRRWREDEIADFEQQRQQSLGDMALSDKDKAERLNSLTTDCESLQRLQRQIDEVNA